MHRTSDQQLTMQAADMFCHIKSFVDLPFSSFLLSFFSLFFFLHHGWLAGGFVLFCSTAAGKNMDMDMDLAMESKARLGWTGLDWMNGIRDTRIGSMSG